MNKKFDCVRFQREQRTKLSKKLSKMTAPQMLDYFRAKPLPKEKVGKA